MENFTTSLNEETLDSSSGLRMLRMKTIAYLTVVALAVLVFSSVGCRGPETKDQPPKPPNVFLLSIDTLRADHVSGYGYSRQTTPFLDQLAAEGLVVRDAIVATHGTAPSHASMLTSVPQEVHGVGLLGRADDPVPTSLRNLPEVFRDSGYHTVAVTEGGNVGGHFGFDRGFQVFNDRARGVDEGRDRLVPHLAEIPDDQSVFVFFHTYEVHSPYDPPPDLVGRFGASESAFATSSQNLVDHAHRARELSPEDLDHIRARYDEGIVFADRILRSLFESLQQLGHRFQNIFTDR